MVDLFRDIPADRIELVLRNIRGNLGRVGLHDGHTIRKHVDVQPGVLQTRLTFSDLRFATSFYDYRIAKMAVQSMLEQCYEEKIAAWLTGIHSDFLVLKSDTGKGIGYGYRREDEELHEGLRKIRLVLEKQPERDWGFRIFTCYPVF